METHEKNPETERINELLKVKLRILLLSNQNNNCQLN